MFEDRTYERLVEECLAAAPPGADLRQGGIFFDAVASACFKIAEYYTDLRTVFELVFLPTAAGEYLDRKGSEFRVTRNPATPARYEYTWSGASEPHPGERFFTDVSYFMLRRAENQSLYLEAEMPGLSSSIVPGTPAVPMNNIAGLAVSAFGGLIEPGADAESDDSYRNRIMEKIAGPAENGNRQHYKTWCESVSGVGRARIIPLFAGPNTVMGVIIGADGLPAAQTVLDRVQEYIDPMTLGLTVNAGSEVIPVGDGLGDGAANIGAHFAAVAPDLLEIDVSFSAELQAGYTEAQLKTDATAAITEFLKNLVFTTPEREAVIVRMSSISSLLYGLSGLIDYSSLTLNGATANITLTDRQVAALGEVTVNAVV